MVQARFPRNRRLVHYTRSQIPQKSDNYPECRSPQPFGFSSQTTSGSYPFRPVSRAVMAPAVVPVERKTKGPKLKCRSCIIGRLCLSCYLLRYAAWDYWSSKELYDTSRLMPQSCSTLFIGNRRYSSAWYAAITLALHPERSDCVLAPDPAYCGIWSPRRGRGVVRLMHKVRGVRTTPQWMRGPSSYNSELIYGCRLRRASSKPGGLLQQQSPTQSVGDKSILMDFVYSGLTKFPRLWRGSALQISWAPGTKWSRLALNSGLGTLRSRGLYDDPDRFLHTNVFCKVAQTSQHRRGHLFTP